MSAAPELDQVRHAGLRVGGADVAAAGGRTYAVSNPATGALLAHVADAGSEDVTRAVAAARAAFAEGTWRRMPAPRRGEVAREIRSGLLSINSDSSSYIQAPFGGYGQSGLGKEQGLEGLYDFTEVKNIYVSDR